MNADGIYRRGEKFGVGAEDGPTPDIIGGTPPCRVCGRDCYDAAYRVTLTDEQAADAYDVRRAQVAKATSVWMIAEAVAGVTERLLYDGPPGTGKTFAAQRFGVRKGQPVYNLTCTEEMPAAEIRGHFVPAGDQFVWMDGPGVRAMREGGRLVINEIEKASGDVQTLLLAILDDRESCALTLPTGETVVPAGGYTMHATMNGDADTDLPEALRSRFPVRIRVEEVHPDAIKRLPQDLQAMAKATGENKDAERRVTIRAWLEFARLRPVVGEAIAAKAIFGSRAKEVLETLKLAKEKVTAEGATA